MSIKQQSEELDRVWRTTAVVYEECAKSVGLSLSGLLVLTAIADNDGACTQKSVCTQTFLPKQSVNSIVAGLMRDGHITLAEIDTDRRNKCIRLTQKGREYADKIVPKIHQAEHRAMERLTEKQRTGLIESSRQYGTYFQECMREFFEIA
ncbi:MAG: MarR family transcriptional regulator [Planctomycetaceae bacterium]|nr:MarR family transcriptional regulator [Planctomycetaceae bacterium]